MKNEYFKTVANRPEFAKFEVGQNRRGTIFIKVAGRGTNDAYYCDENKNKKFGIQYQLGHSNGQYWIRRRNGGFIFPLHYDRKTRKYGFKTFEAALEYLLKCWPKLIKQ